MAINAIFFHSFFFAIVIGIINTSGGIGKIKLSINDIKPKNFLEIGIFHGVTARNVCELLYNIHGTDFKFTGIDLFSSENISKNLICFFFKSLD